MFKFLFCNSKNNIMDEILGIVNLILIVIIIIVLVLCIIRSKVSCKATDTTAVSTDKSDVVVTTTTPAITTIPATTTTAAKTTTTPIITTTTIPVTPVSTACVGITSTGATCIGNIAQSTTPTTPTTGNATTSSTTTGNTTTAGIIPNGKPQIVLIIVTSKPLTSATDNSSNPMIDSIIFTVDGRYVSDLKVSNENSNFVIRNSTGVDLTDKFQGVGVQFSTDDSNSLFAKHPELKINTITSAQLLA
jgi:hypothetical protein